MAKHTDMLSKAIDELLDEYEGVLSKNDMAPVDAKLSDDEQGDPLAPGDTKGGLQPAGGGQGNPKDGTGNAPTSIGIEVKLPLKSVSPKGDGMGNDPISNGDGAVAKADGSTPPGFKGKDDQKSSGAEDEDAESEAGEDEEAPAEGDEESEGAEGGSEGDEPEGDEDGAEGDEDQGGFPGKGEEGEEGEDPKMDAAVEKALYKFMAKIGMTGEMGKADFAKSDDFSDLDPMTLEPRIKAAEALAKSETDTVRKSLTEELAKRDAQIEQLSTLVKGLSDQIGRLAKAPVARPRAVQGYAPLQKSEGDVAPISKSALIEKALGLMKAGKLHDKTLVAKMEMAPPEVAAHLARQAGIE